MNSGHMHHTSHINQHHFIADRKHVYNNAMLFVDSCNSTAKKDRTTGERGPATELKLGTYALSWGFQFVAETPS